MQPVVNRVGRYVQRLGCGVDVHFSAALPVVLGHCNPGALKASGFKD